MGSTIDSVVRVIPNSVYCAIALQWTLREVTIVSDSSVVPVAQGRRRQTREHVGLDGFGESLRRFCRSNRVIPNTGTECIRRWLLKKFLGAKLDATCREASFVARGLDEDGYALKILTTRPINRTAP